MSNYISNKMICSKKFLNDYLIDYYPFDAKEKLKKPYITFNKLFNLKSLDEYRKQIGTHIDYGYGFSYKKLNNDLYEVKFHTRNYYPIEAIVRSISLDHNVIWYATEEEYIYLSQFSWNKDKIVEDVLPLEKERFYKWQDENENLYESLSDSDDDIWYYDYDNDTDWKIWDCDDLIKRYNNNYPAHEFYRDILSYYQVRYDLYNKFVKVRCNTGAEISGIFTDDFEDDEEIAVNGVLIKYDEIVCMEAYYSPMERHLMLVLSKEDIDFIRNIKIDTNTTDILTIIDQLEDYLQTHGISNNDLNKNGIHCEEILNKIANLDSLVKEDLYTYVSVVYDDDIVATTIGEPSFYYKTDLPIKVGDKVLVDRCGHHTTGEVIEVEYREKNNVPYPIEKTKDIIKIIENSKTDKDNLINICDNDDYDNRILTIYSLNCIELNKNNIDLLSKNEILFIEDDDSDGSLYFMDDKINLYHVNVKYSKDKSINKEKIFSILPKYKNTLSKNQKDYRAINLGMGHALLIKSSIYENYIKFLKSKIKYENEFEDFYNAYCYWMTYAIEYLQQ